jgi:hypothetical protein
MAAAIFEVLRESKTAWDYLDVVAPIPAEQAFRSIAEAGCQFNKT